MRGRILVVDDDATFRELMREVLEDEGCAVEPCAEWQAAHALARDTCPDAILLDVRLGGGPHGWEVLDALLADPATAETPVVLCSAQAARELAAHEAALARAGAIVLAKPFRLEDLLAALEGLLGGKARD